MWFEILPSFGIITVALAAPHAFAFVANKLVLGNSYRRTTSSQDQILQYLRDERLTGHPYKLTGLDAIPDK